MEIFEKVFTNKKEQRKIITQLKREINQLIEDTFYLMIEKLNNPTPKKSSKINQRICINCHYYPKLEKVKNKAKRIKESWRNCHEIKELLINIPCNGCWGHVDHENFEKRKNL